jgi:flagellar motor switch protein FliG
MQRVETPAKQKLIKDLEDLGREDVINAMDTLSEVSIFIVAEIAHYVETNDKEGLDKMVDRAKRHGQAVIRSGPLGT